MPNYQNPLIEHSPILKQAAKEIGEILERHKIAGAIQLANSTHAEFVMQFPDWSAVQLMRAPDGSPGVHIKSSAERDGSAHLESSMHCLLSLRDMAVEQAGFLLQLCEQVLEVLKREGVELEHKTLQQQASEAIFEPIEGGQ